jgi:hypothetical protein
MHHNVNGPEPEGMNLVLQDLNPDWILWLVIQQITRGHNAFNQAKIIGYLHYVNRFNIVFVSYFILVIYAFVSERLQLC